MPQRRAVAAEHQRWVAPASVASLPPQLQMFMRGCPPELGDKRHRINCREIVMRNLLALSAGVRRTLCWNLAPDIPAYRNPLSVMDLLFGKLVLMDHEGAELRHRHPSAETFVLLADQFAGVDRVTRIQVPARPACCCSTCGAADGDRCWWSGSSATPSTGRMSRRWPSTGRGRQHRQRPSTRCANDSQSRCSMAGWSYRCRSPRCSSLPIDPGSALASQQLQLVVDPHAASAPPSGSPDSQPPLTSPLTIYGRSTRILRSGPLGRSAPLTPRGKPRELPKEQQERERPRACEPWPSRAGPPGPWVLDCGASVV
jgi:hypothetical protein